MHNSYEISTNIKKLAQRKHISIKQLLEDCNINKGLIYDLEHKQSFPSCDKLARIADYLDCSVDYLLGRTNQEKFSGESYTLSPDEQTLVNTFRKLPPESQHNILGFLDYTASVIINYQDTSKR